MASQRGTGVPPVGLEQSLKTRLCAQPQIVEMQAGSRRNIPLILSPFPASHSSMPQTIAVIDFGSQYTQIIARRIRECQVYSKLYHYTVTAEELRQEPDDPRSRPSRPSSP